LWYIGTFSDVFAPIPLPGRFELRGSKGQTTVVFTYGPGRVTETWYDPSAVAVALYQVYGGSISFAFGINFNGTNRGR